MTKISLAVLTSNSWRHRYVANRLISAFNVLGAVSEVKRSLNKGKTEEENEVIKIHTQKREVKEKEFFGGETKFNLPTQKVLNVEYGGINSPEVFEWIKGLRPDYIALFGTGIVKAPLLSYYENKIINLHLGLSPYYRGSATLFWPLVEGEPECVGVTVHLATDKVDAGSIFVQCRPEIGEGDNSHDIGFKAIKAGADAFIRAIAGYAEGKITPQSQQLEGGKVFKLADFGAGPVLKLKENFAKGMIGEYLRNKEKRD